MSASAEAAPARIVVLASGRGSNLAALIAAQRAARFRGGIVAVFSDKAQAGALAVAREAGVAAHHVSPRDHADRRAFDHALFGAIGRLQPTLIVCAGYMRIITDDVAEAFADRMINIHPSLLPAYQGLDTHSRVLAAGDRRHGASVHFVTPELDGGPVIAQATIDVQAGDTPASLAQRLLPIEHRLLVASVDVVTRRALAPTPAGVALDGHVLSRPLQLRDDDRLVTADGDVA